MKMTHSKAKEKAMEFLETTTLGETEVVKQGLSKEPVDAFRELHSKAIDIALKEQAKEIHKWLCLKELNEEDWNSKEFAERWLK